MGFTKNLRKENAFTTKCADRKFKCLSFPETNYVFSITQKIYEIYSLNQRIYELTTELWNNFLTVIHKEEFIYEKGVCYDILNPKNCDDLNIHYHIFNEKLILYQQSYFDMPENESNYLLKELSDLLLGFLDSPLFSLGNNIKHLIIRIQKPDMSNVEESYIDLSTEKEVDKMLNEFLIAYLQFLSDLLDRFNLTYDSLKLNNLKEVIKTRITSIKIQKKEYLKRLSVYKPILNPTTSTTLDGSDDHSITPSIITEKTTKVTRTDHTTTSDFSYNTNITTQYLTEQKFTTFDDLETTKSIVFSDNFESSLKINSSEKYNFTDRYKNVCGATSDNWIIFVSILVTLFLIVSLVIFLTVFIFKRYKLKKKKFKIAESIQLDAEPHHGVPIYFN